MGDETKWTPGPWEWIEDGFHGGFSGLFSNDAPVIYPQRENDGDDGAAWFGVDEDYYGETALTKANARLIAAAPELYEALEALLEYRDKLAVEKARAALAKARGEV